MYNISMDAAAVSIYHLMNVSADENEDKELTVSCHSLTSLLVPQCVQGTWSSHQQLPQQEQQSFLKYKYIKKNFKR